MKLDSINRRKVKVCPCGKSNSDGKFVPFKNQTKYGFCHSCGDLIKPDSKVIDFHFKKKPEIPKEFFSQKYYSKLLYDYNNENNDFVYFLNYWLGVYNADEVVKKYHLGTGENNAVIFPQIDYLGNIYGLKYMLYNKLTGRRIKRKYGLTVWSDNSIKHRHKPCLFGLHQLKSSNKIIAICESEKTACIMSVFMPQYIWMACGGSDALNTEKLKHFNGRKVHLFPDHGKYLEWSEKMERFESKYKYTDFKISRECEIWFDEGKLQDKGDIADYYLSNYKWSHNERKFNTINY